MFPKPRYTKSDVELREIARARAAIALEDILVVAGKCSAKLASTIGVDSAAAGLLGVAHALYVEALREVQYEYAIEEDFGHVTGLPLQPLRHGTRVIRRQPMTPDEIESELGAERDEEPCRHELAGGAPSITTEGVCWLCRRKVNQQ